MRRGILELCLIIIVVIGIHAERLLHNGSIEGRVSPRKASPRLLPSEARILSRLSVMMAILGWNFNPETGG